MKLKMNMSFILYLISKVLMVMNDFKKYILGVIVVFLYCLPSFCQSNYICVVIDIHGINIPNVSVQHFPSQKYYKTNEKGNVKLQDLFPDDRLVFTHLNFEKLEISVKQLAGSLDTITLLSDMELIEEVVINTGYQQLKGKYQTGSFQHIIGKDIDRSTSKNILSRIENISTGIAFDRSSYDFNAQGRNESPNMTLHGLSALSGDTRVRNAPLIVVDNFPYDGDVNSINPSDVENITILKDAAASSIWGAKAGNGVIVITTKKGEKSSRPNVVFRSNLVFSGKPDLYARQIIESKDLIEVQTMLYDKGYYTSIINGRAKASLPPVVELYLARERGELDDSEVAERIFSFQNTDIRDDYTKYFYRKGYQKQQFLSLSGGNNYVKYYNSFSYDDAKSVRVGDKNKRIVINSRNTIDISKALSLDLQLSWNRLLNYNSYGSEFYFNAGHKFPYSSLLGENGESLDIPKDYNQSFLNSLENLPLLDWKYRPYDELFSHRISEKQNQVITNIGLNIKPFEGALVEMQYQYRASDQKSDRIADQDSYYARNVINRFSSLENDILHRVVPLGDILNENRANSDFHSGRLQTSIIRSFTNSNLSVFLGAEIQSKADKSIGSSTYGYDKERLLFAPNLNYGIRYPIYGNLAGDAFIPNGVSRSVTAYRSASFYGNGSYVYNNKYVINGSLRKDASNVFGVDANAKWTPLWSSGLAWIVNEEKWFNLDIVDYLKLRATYGVSGNIDLSMSGLVRINHSSAFVNGITWPTATIGTAPNPELSWEKVYKKNVGVDFSLFRSKLIATVDFYQKETRDLFDYAPLDPSVGTTAVVKNIASTRSHGVDLNLTSQQRWQKFTLRNTLRLAYNNNWISKTYLDYPGPLFILNRPIVSYKEAMAYGLYTYKWGGLNSVDGRPQGYVNGELSTDYAKIQSKETKFEDLILHGSRRPLYFGSFQTDIDYQKFSFSFIVNYKFKYFFKRDGIDYSRLFSGADGHRDYYNRWTKEGDELLTDVPALVYPLDASVSFYHNSEPLIEKGDHVRLSDVRLGYRVALEKYGVKTLNFYCYLSNIGILWRANKQRLDPDVGGAIPVPREVSFGINFNF